MNEEDARKPFSFCCSGVFIAISSCLAQWVPNETTNQPTNLDMEYDTEFEVREDNIEVMGLDVHNPVFFTSAGRDPRFLLVCCVSLFIGLRYEYRLLKTIDAAE